MIDTISLKMLVVLMLAITSITFTVVFSSLPVWWRIRDALTSASEFFEGLLSCPFCTGFWVSAVVNGSYVYGVLSTTATVAVFFEFLLLSFVGALVAYCGCSLMLKVFE